MKTPMSDKSEAVKAVIERVFPGTAKAIAEHRCPMCGGPITEFTDAESIREYEISGLCQKCQDDVFATD
jgi:uncharacterized protein with PIN domain